MTQEKATFAAGCFWGVQYAFQEKFPMIIDITVGYTGGHTANPTYEEVCSHTTGHAEAVQITFDPAQISYIELLQTFWDCHNPTQLNRQGPDVGTQYRSAIFYHSDAQKKLAVDSQKELEDRKKFSSPIVTQIQPAMTFYKAEDYHQNYFKKHEHSHCRISNETNT